MPKARNLQACQECRSRKVRCDGARPSCNACWRTSRACHWPDSLAPGNFKYVFVGNDQPNPPQPGNKKPLRGEKRWRQEDHQLRRCHGHSSHQDGSLHRQANGDDDDKLPVSLRQRLLHIFSQTHQMLELCGSIDMDIFKRDAPAAEDSFLLQSIFALSALYLADAEARSDSCFASSRNLMGRYRSKAQASSRLLSDEPSVVTIQANLVLGLCELLTMATSKAWLHIGLAIRMAQTLRMRRENNRRLVPRQREIRRRTFWSCVVLDRLVAYCTFRTQTIELPLVEIHLPCTEVAFAFGHDNPGPTIDELGRDMSAASAEKMTLAYFIKTFLLWSAVSRFYVDGGRGKQSSDSRRPCVSLLEHEAIMSAWRDSLPGEMQWSERNLRAHQSLGQLSHFASMHLLIQHALFLAQHEHLPHIEETDLPHGVASPPNDFDVAVITTCLEGANQVVAMLRLIDSNTTGLRHTQLGICAGVPIVTTASVLLWTVHCSQKATLSVQLSDSEISQASSDVDYLVSILDAWAKTWSLARAWANCIRLLDEFCRSRYGRGACDSGASATEEEGRMEKSDAPTEQRQDNQSGAPSPTPLRDGDGFPDLTMIPNDTFYKVRLITGLILEQPEVCKKLLQGSRELPPGEPAEEQADSWDVDLDFSWINNPNQLMAASTLWPELPLLSDEY